MLCGADWITEIMGSSISEGILLSTNKRFSIVGPRSFPGLPSTPHAFLSPSPQRKWTGHNAYGSVCILRQKDGTVCKLLALIYSVRIRRFSRERKNESRSSTTARWSRREVCGRGWETWQWGQKIWGQKFSLADSILSRLGNSASEWTLITRGPTLTQGLMIGEKSSSWDEPAVDGFPQLVSELAYSPSFWDMFFHRHLI